MKVIFLDVDGVLNSVDTSEVFQGFVGMVKQPQVVLMTGRSSCSD